LLRLVEQGLSREALRQEDFLALEGVGRLDQATFRGRQRRLGRTQGVQFILRVELRQHLVWRDTIADIACSLDDAAADAEGERGFVLGADLSGQDDHFAGAALRGGDRADRPRLDRLGFGLLLATGNQQRNRRQ
jgi:hypothetical protein